MKKLLLVGSLIVSGGLAAWAQEIDVDVDVDEAMPHLVAEAVGIFQEKQNSGHPIPAGVIRQAKAIGLIEVTKGGLGVAGSRGTGVIVTRVGAGWSAPFAFVQGGGSIGFQIGVNVKKYIYVFNSPNSWTVLTGDGKAEFKAGAEATAGPDSYSEDAAKGVPTANIYVYSLSEGAFAGAAVGGQTFLADKEINRKAYGTSSRESILGGSIPCPAYAKPLHDVLKAAASGGVPAPDPLPPAKKK